MRYDNLRAFEKHLEGASPNHFSPLYFIIGKEEFDCKEAIDLLIRFLVPTQQDRSMAVSKWDGASLNLSDLMTDLYSRSFFSDKRVILVQQAEKLKKNALEEIEKYIASDCRSQFLILNAPTFSKLSNFYKSAEKGGIILEFAEPKPWEKEKKMVEWVGKEATAARKLMSYQLCQQFVKQLGTDQAALVNELEKLFCYVGTRQEIVRKDIDLICTAIPTDTVWQLGEAIFRREGGLALRICQGILMDGQPFLPLLRQVRNQFVTEFQVCALLERGRDVAQEFPYMKGQILEKHIQNARQYGLESFRKGLLAIDQAEIRAKNSQIDEQLLAELLIVQLTGKL